MIVGLRGMTSITDRDLVLELMVNGAAAPSSRNRFRYLVVNPIRFPSNRHHAVPNAVAKSAVIKSSRDVCKD